MRSVSEIGYLAQRPVNQRIVSTEPIKPENDRRNRFQLCDVKLQGLDISCSETDSEVGSPRDSGTVRSIEELQVHGRDFGGFNCMFIDEIGIYKTNGATAID